MTCIKGASLISLRIRLFYVEKVTHFLNMVPVVGGASAEQKAGVGLSVGVAELETHNLGVIIIPSTVTYIPPAVLVVYLHGAYSSIFVTLNPN